MSFLADLFKKKDAHFYLQKAEKALGRENWVEARNQAEDGLAKQEGGEADAALQKALNAAKRGICDMNREEAQYSAEAGELERAADLLNVAMDNAPSEAIRKSLRKELDRLERRAVHRERNKRAPGGGRKPPPSGQSIGGSDRAAGTAPTANEVDLFEVYIAGLVPEVAEQYRQLGPDFMIGYIALNEGKPQESLTLFEKVEADGSALAYLNFEFARVLLMLGMVDRAAALLQVTREIHGYGPVYLSGSPCVAQLEAEVHLSQGHDDAALKVVDSGLAAAPSDHLMVLKVQILTRQKNYDQAVDLLESQIKENAKSRDLYMLYYQIEMLRGNVEGASSALERGMSKCCASGSCGPQDTEIPRMLANHYLNQESQSKRVGELLNQIFLAKKGQGDWFDHFLRARYYKGQGEEDRARQNWEEAVRGIPQDHPRLQEVQALFAA